MTEVTTPLRERRPQSDCTAPPHMTAAKTATSLKLTLFQQNLLVVLRQDTSSLLPSAASVQGRDLLFLLTVVVPDCIQVRF
jgi:hypothetical protein